MLYLAIRFEWRFAVAAILANMHDVVIILGCFALFQWEFSLTVLAAVLAVLGYSVNESVAVIGGGMVGCETAEYLAARGCKVSVIEMMDKIAAGESVTILPTLLENYKTYGVEQYPSHKVKEFRMDAVVCENKDGAEVTIPCDYIVLAMGARSNEFDAAALEAASIPVYSIGDAAGKAADISNAIRTGYDTACQL
jgi:thioredoxin reductase